MDNFYHGSIINTKSIKFEYGLRISYKYIASLFFIEKENIGSGLDHNSIEWFKKGISEIKRSHHIFL